MHYNLKTNPIKSKQNSKSKNNDTLKTKDSTTLILTVNH